HRLNKTAVCKPPLLGGAQKRVPTSLCFDRQFYIHRALFFAEGAAQFRERDVLELADSFAGHAEFFPDFLERLWLPAIKSEARENDLSFAIVQHVQQPTDFVPKILVTQQFESRLRFFIADDLAEFG